MWPELFTIPFLDVPLRSFGLLVATGFLVAVGVGAKLSKRYGTEPEKDPERIADVAWWVLIGVIAGGRLAFVIVNLDHFAAHPLDAFKIWEGGLVMYGGLILALLLGVWKARRLSMPGWQSMDYGLTAGFLGQAIGRLGCLAVGDDYGAPTDVAWAISFPEPLPEGSAFPPELAGVPVHPTQLYMSAKALALFLLGLWLLPRKRFHGQVTCVLLAGYALLRFVIEYFRFDMVARGGIYAEGGAPQDVARRLLELGVADHQGRIVDVQRYRELVQQGAEGVAPELLLSTSQMVGIAAFAFAALCYAWLRRRPSQRVAGAGAAAQPAG